MRGIEGWSTEFEERRQMDVVIQPVRSDADLDAAGQLIREYVDWLGIDLSFQNFDAEIADLSAKYAPPTGELFLARREDGQFLGCAGVTSSNRPGACELKRLYVRDAARGTGTGRALVAAAVAAAVSLGYREMLLDTLSTMSSAIGLYRALGFETIPPYYDNPVPGAVFFAKPLSR
jgi:ribosomal protein S18 acetylase RimI-like enzyme